LDYSPLPRFVGKLTGFEPGEGASLPIASQDGQEVMGPSRGEACL
jgi:hypothetical protein